MIEIEIDGKKVKTESGAMIIEAADKMGIKIPRFCYHKKLSIAANCRMCLVEVEKSAKPLPACATPVTAGMVVKTQSKEAQDAQRAVMEFLLINHPLDCPICDQGGECELQDVAMGYGRDISRYNEGKRTIKDENLGTLIATDMTRCILCTRCVRFGEEIAGVRELGVTGRGESSRIGTYIQENMVSEMSGNVIDLCPVGALTSKPFRFKARPWELTQHMGVSPHDCVGSNLYLHTRGDRVYRAVPRENEAINETWISDRDRFSYEGLYEDRLLNPKIKENGQWKTVSWEEAFEALTSKLETLLKKHGSEKVGGIISPSATVEELYLFQRYLRALNCNNIDHRLTQTNFDFTPHENSFTGIQTPFADIEDLDKILLVGIDSQREQPITGHRVRKAFLQGAEILAINPMDFEFNVDVSHKIIAKPSELTLQLAGVVKALCDVSAYPHAEEWFAAVKPTAEQKAMAQALKSGEKVGILVGALALNHPDMDVIYSLVDMIHRDTDASLFFMTAGSNSAGAWSVGAIPHMELGGRKVLNPGLNTKHMWEGNLKGYFLYGIEPEMDCAHSQVALDALNAADLVVMLTPFVSKTMEEYADILLPIAPFAEISGTYVNVEGQWQRFRAASAPQGEARPGWKVLRVLGNFAQLDNFDYQTVDEVHDEVSELLENLGEELPEPWNCPDKSLHAEKTQKGIERIAQWPLYRVDSLVRRSRPLQHCAANEELRVFMHPAFAKKLHKSEGESVTVIQEGKEVSLPVCVSTQVPEGAVYIPAGYDEVSSLNHCYGTVELKGSE